MSFNKISATAISYTNDKSWNVNKPKNRESLNIGTEITKYKMKLKERYKKDKKISTTQQVKEFWMDVENQSNTRYFQQDQIKSIRNKAKASPQLNKSQDNIRSNSKTVKIESLKDEEFLKSREVPLWNKNIKLGNKIVENSDTLYSLLCRRKKDL